MAKEIVHGAPSWRIESSNITAFLTEKGGHLGPVNFRFGRRVIQPFSIAPWAGLLAKSKYPVLIKNLRGDFFCLPFGGNQTPFKKEQHPPHGETANGTWRLVDLLREEGITTGRWELQTEARRGTVEKTLALRDGSPALYCRHVLRGMRGPMNLGHHAMLKFAPEEGSGRISSSGFQWGQVYPGQFEDPASGGYTSLKPGARFRSLHRVPLAAGGFTDLSRYPAREGFEDLVQLAGKKGNAFSWTAVTFPKQGYLWIALADPKILSSTVLWHSNGGRHYAPWSGRHRGVLGLEDVTSYFHEGLAESVKSNPLQKNGIPTCLELKPRIPLIVNYIMAVVEIPANFDILKEVHPADDGIWLISQNGLSVWAGVDWRFLAQ